MTYAVEWLMFIDWRGCWGGPGPFEEEIPEIPVPWLLMRLQALEALRRWPLPYTGGGHFGVWSDEAAGGTWAVRWPGGDFCESIWWSGGEIPGNSYLRPDEGCLYWNAVRNSTWATQAGGDWLCCSLFDHSLLLFTQWYIVDVPDEEWYSVPDLFWCCCWKVFLFVDPGGNCVLVPLIVLHSPFVRGWAGDTEILTFDYCCSHSDDDCYSPFLTMEFILGILLPIPLHLMLIYLGEIWRICYGDKLLMPLIPFYRYCSHSIRFALILHSLLVICCWLCTCSRLLAHYSFVVVTFVHCWWCCSYWPLEVMTVGDGGWRRPGWPYGDVVTDVDSRCCCCWSLTRPHFIGVVVLWKFVGDLLCDSGGVLQTGEAFCHSLLFGIHHSVLWCRPCRCLVMGRWLYRQAQAFWSGAVGGGDICWSGGLLLYSVMFLMLMMGWYLLFWPHYILFTFVDHLHFWRWKLLRHLQYDLRPLTTIVVDVCSHHRRADAGDGTGDPHLILRYRHIVELSDGWCGLVGMSGGLEWWYWWYLPLMLICYYRCHWKFSGRHLIHLLGPTFVVLLGWGSHYLMHGPYRLVAGPFEYWLLHCLLGWVPTWWEVHSCIPHCITVTTLPHILHCSAVEEGPHTPALFPWRCSGGSHIWCPYLEVQNCCPSGDGLTWRCPPPFCYILLFHLLFPRGRWAYSTCRLTLKPDNLTLIPLQPKPIPVFDLPLKAFAIVFSVTIPVRHCWSFLMIYCSVVTNCC